MVPSVTTVLLSDGHMIAGPSLEETTVCCVTSSFFKKNLSSMELVIIFTRNMGAISVVDWAMAHAVGKTTAC